MLLLWLQTRAVAEKTNELKAKHAAAVAALLQRYKQLRTEVARYNKALDALVDTSSSGSQQQQRQQQGLEGAVVGGVAAAHDDIATGSRDQ